MASNQTNEATVTRQSSSAPRSFQDLADFAATAGAYRELRVKHPGVPARLVHQYTRDDGGRNFSEFVCEVTRGHDWQFSDEDRCYCSNCGADGDA